MEKYDVQPCPWCGVIADVVEYPDTWDDYDTAIECNNPDCEIRPRTDVYKNREDALAAWNNRAI